MVSPIPVIKVEEFLLVSVQVELTDATALRLLQDVLAEIRRTGVRGLVIDVTAVDVVDSFMGRVLNDMASMARVLGTETVLAGLQPAVAITLVELGVMLRGLDTALTVEKAMRRLRRGVGVGGRQ